MGEAIRSEELLTLDELLTELKKRVSLDANSVMKWAQVIKYVESASGVLMLLVDKDLNLVINSTVEEPEIQSGLLTAASEITARIDSVDELDEEEDF